MKVAFVTHFCPHYRVRTYELLARGYDIDYFFYSKGNEWYWLEEHGVRTGNFHHTYLPGFQLTQRIRVAPSLLTKLWRGNYAIFIKCINGRFALPVTYLTARLRRKPFVLWTGIWMTLQTPFHRLAFPLTRWIYQHADAIVVYGEHVKRYLVGLGIPPERIFIAAHAVDNPVYSRPISDHEKMALKSKSEVGDHRIVLYLGRLEEIKGIKYLMEAFAHLNPDNAILVVIGEGSLREQLKVLAVKLGIQEKTRFIGYVPPEETLAYYAIADMLVLPSVTMPTGKETWGLVVNEAMNQGVPVVATEAVGAAAGGLVQSGINGFVVPEQNSAALAQAIQRILADAQLREEMSQNARRIIAEWDNELMIKGFKQAIEFCSRSSI